MLLIYEPIETIYFHAHASINQTRYHIRFELTIRNIVTTSIPSVHFLQGLIKKSSDNTKIVNHFLSDVSLPEKKCI